MFNKNIGLKSYSSIIEVINNIPSGVPLTVYLEHLDKSFKENEILFYEDEKYIRNIKNAFEDSNSEGYKLILENNLDKEKVIDHFLKGNICYEATCIDYFNIVFKQAKKLRPDLIDAEFINKYNSLKKEYTEKMKKFEDDYNIKFESGYFNK